MIAIGVRVQPDWEVGVRERGQCARYNCLS